MAVCLPVIRVIAILATVTQIVQSQDGPNPYPHYGRSGNRVPNAEFRRGLIAAQSSNSDPNPSEQVRRRFTNPSATRTAEATTAKKQDPYPWYGKSGNRLPGYIKPPVDSSSSNGNVDTEDRGEVSTRRGGETRPRNRGGSRRGRPDNNNNKNNNNNNNNNRNSGNGLDLSNLPVIGGLVDPGIKDDLVNSLKGVKDTFTLKNLGNILGLIRPGLGIGGIGESITDTGDIGGTDLFPDDGDDDFGDDDWGDLDFETWETDWPDDVDWEGAGDANATDSKVDTNGPKEKKSTGESKTPDKKSPKDKAASKVVEPEGKTAPPTQSKNSGKLDETDDWGDEEWGTWPDEDLFVDEGKGGKEAAKVTIGRAPPKKSMTPVAGDISPPSDGAKWAKESKDYNFYYFLDDADVQKIDREKEFYNT